ncbi:MFS transporter [Nocardioides sp.]|uniref:MFS transporter n=1 Tax=Nocardioides sp. TaxID=35761 RepID=UPI002B26B772|nr:MFS transporter [Nocardioides sp.]
MGFGDKAYSTLVKRDLEVERELPEQARADIPSNALRLIGAHALQSSGDQATKTSTVLPWLFYSLGVPPALTGVLVPIRESGSMLPQAFLTPLVLRVRHRKWVFVTGALIQAVTVAAMAMTAAVGSGLAAGVVIVVALTIFSLGRCLGSISSKDVQGRTVPKGQRGQINGLATIASGLVALTLGLGVRLFGGEDLRADQLAWLLAGGAACWVGVAAVYAGIREPADVESTPPAHPEAEQQAPGAVVQSWALLRDDRDFRLFVTVRSLLLVSALSPPFVVTLAVSSGMEGLAGLGSFIIASGLAALIGGGIFGRWADRSSAGLMSAGAAMASVVIVALVVIVTLPAFSEESAWSDFLFVGCFFLLTLLHTGVRVGRKTYVVDMAEGDQRTTYVAVSNSAMGVILLVVGGVSSLLAIAAVEWALLFLAGMGIVGVYAARRLPNVSHGAS